MIWPFTSRILRERDEARAYARKLHALMRDRSERSAKGQATRKAAERAAVIARANEIRAAHNMPEIQI